MRTNTNTNTNKTHNIDFLRKLDENGVDKEEIINTLLQLYKCIGNVLKKFNININLIIKHIYVQQFSDKLNLPPKIMIKTLLTVNKDVIYKVLYDKVYSIISTTFLKDIFTKTDVKHIVETILDKHKNNIINFMYDSDFVFDFRDLLKDVMYSFDVNKIAIIMNKLISVYDKSSLKI